MVDLATLFIQSNYHEKYVIHLSNSLNTSYNKYIEVQNGLGQALLNARNELSQELFESDYDGLTDENRKKIRKIMPQKISEADLLDQ